MSFRNQTEVLAAHQGQFIRAESKSDRIVIPLIEPVSR